MPAICAVPAQNGFSSEAPRAYEAHELVALPHFRDGQHLTAIELLEAHRLLPKRVRYVADIQRFMLSHAAMALHLEHTLDPSKPGVTATNLLRFFENTPAASKNTVLAFLVEMRHYNFVEPVDEGDRRSRAFRATVDTEQLIRFYFDTHARGLDCMDGGNRAALLAAHPRLLHLAQPRFARLLLHNQNWRNPPGTIAGFTKSDSGSSVIHDLVARVPRGELGSDPIWIGSISATEVAKRYLVSTTHAVRLFSRAKAQGLIGWQGSTNRGECWISPILVQDYYHWQAQKFAAVSDAIQFACEKAGIGPT
ncbi:hypothetical protein [Neorhizobium sp. JUb45]|uniref:hypothetical protein n=1 Tax=unclassified Neorhizobium TaxID=2629175 RepID=UPI001047434E|nr:hypothetical protein [Neorhizobium sp. JUb45]TCR07177.1 hypothetical protein EDF70_1011146 [Neorhizobium sp. JUb45]